MKLFRRHAIGVVLGLFISNTASQAQAVSQIISDYNGWWKTSSSTINPVRPDNRHHLLAFTYNGTTYSTGINDGLLTSNGEAYVPGEYQALPLQNVNSSPNSNTKIGLGAMADGVYNGAGPAPSRDLGTYLSDGTQGLDLGTCVANLPTGTMFMSVSNIQSAKIGDGVPDIVVTQVADPSSSFDSYEFTDVNGVRIGNSLDIVLNNIPALGNWVADFYEATGTTILSSGFTQTQRAIRLWAADFSVFGIDSSNSANVAYFKINLSGTSDIAFVAYNTTTITIQQVLDLQALPERLRRNVDVVEQETGVSVAPNPATTMTKISHRVAVPGDKVLMYNAVGIKMKEVNCSVGAGVTSLEVSALPKGYYHVVVRSREQQPGVRLLVQ